MGVLRLLSGSSPEPIANLCRHYAAVSACVSSKFPGCFVRQITDYVGVNKYTNATCLHYLTGIQDPRDKVIGRQDFDSEGRLTRSTDATGKTTEFIHNLDGRVEVVRDRLGHTNSFVYDLRGNVIFNTNAVGSVMAYAYDTKNQKVAETNAIGTPSATWSTFGYDDRGFLTASTNAVSTNVLTYNNSGQPTSVTDPRGITNRNDYATDTGYLLAANNSSLSVLSPKNQPRRKAL